MPEQRCPKEVFIEKYYGREFANEDVLIKTDFGDLVNLLYMWEAGQSTLSISTSDIPGALSDKELGKILSRIANQNK